MSEELSETTKMVDENKGGEQDDMCHKLQDEGLEPNCTDQEKITHLWRLYLKSEASLKTALETITELQQQQAEEMKEFEKYVEHVRSLSAEREALTVEFATENDQLKADNDQLRQELESFKNDETTDMLLQQGLDDIAHGTTSEQIAYLLVERARLMDELEAEEQRHLVETPDGLMSAEQLHKQLEEEREEFEVELRRQCEYMNKTKESLKSNHEEEVSALMAENEQLQVMLDVAKKQTQSLEAEAATQKSSSTESLADKNNGDLKRKLAELENAKEEEMLSWKRRLKDMEHEKQTQMDEVESLNLEFRREQARSKNQLDEYEETMRQMREDKKEREELVASIEAKNHKLTTEKKSTDLKLGLMEQDIEDLRERERDLVNKQKALLSSNGNANLESETQSLIQEKQKLEDELQTVQESLHSEKQYSTSLEDNIKRLEADLEEAKIDFEDEERALKAKTRALESQVLFLESELNTVQDHQPISTNDDNKQQEMKLHLQDVTDQKIDMQLKLDEQREHISVIQTQLDSANKNINRLDESKVRLEKDNDCLVDKLHQTKKEYVQKEKDLFEERDKTKDKDGDKDERLNKANIDLEELHHEIRKITSDLYSKEEQIAQLHIQIEGDKAQAESTKQALERHVENQRSSHEAQMESLTDRLDEALKDNKLLKRNIAEKQRELDNLRDEVVKVKVTNTTVGSNSSESDMAWLSRQAPQNKVQELHKRNSALEIKNDELQIELDKALLSLSESKDELARLKGEINGEALIAHTRADVAEKRTKAESDIKLYTLQEELSAAKLRLEFMERDAKQAASVKEQLHLKQEEVMKLCNQLQEEKFSRSLAGMGSDDINNQLATVRQREHELQQRNNELQHMLLDVEAKLETMKNQTRSNADVREKAAQGKKSSEEEQALLHKEVERLQNELFSLSERYDQQLSRYNDRRNRTRNKLQKARDVFSTEKSKLKVDIEKLERESSLTKKSLKKELEWKEEMDMKYHTLLLEKRDLLSQLAEQDEVVRDHNRQLSVLQVRSKFMEEENNTLQQRVDSLVRQKQNLDRIIKEYQLERHKEELHKILSLSTAALISPRAVITPEIRNLLQSATSGLGNSADFSFDHSLDAIISPRVNTPMAEFSNKLNKTMPALGQRDQNVDSSADNTGFIHDDDDDDTDNDVMSDM